MEKNEGGSSRVQLVTIGGANATQRIDNFLISKLKGVPKSRIYRMLRKGEVRVNRGRAKADFRLSCGDVVRIPPVRIAVTTTRQLPRDTLKARLGNRVLYEDSHLLVFNKPCGLAVHGGSGLSFGLIEGLRQFRSDDPYLELVHRLDRETSGCLLIAKRRSVLRCLHELFRSDRVAKYYSVLMTGVVREKRMTVNAPLRKNVKKGGERMVQVSDTGKSARTEFIRRRKFAKATLVEAQPKSGRTHQIRVHAASLGHPVAGDGRYGDAERNREFRTAGLRRLFLHAASLEFDHPQTGELLRIEAPLETQLAGFLNRLADEG